MASDDTKELAERWRALGVPEAVISKHAGEDYNPSAIERVELPEIAAAKEPVIFQLRGRHRIDLTGQRFGKWQVLDKYDNRGRWLCRCECGAEKYVWPGCLKCGHSKSCRSCGHKKYRGELTGQQIGKWQVISFNTGPSLRSHYLCRCECGAEHFVGAYQLKTGASNGCMSCMHPTKLSPAKREQIRLALLKGKRSRVAVMREVGVSYETVTNIARQMKAR